MGAWDGGGGQPEVVGSAFSNEEPEAEANSGL